MNLNFWIMFRLSSSGRRLLSLVSLTSLFGMSIGVACLVVAMAVVSGFENTLKQSVIDVFGHVLVVKQNSSNQGVEDIYKRIKKAAPEVTSYTPFLQFDGILAYDAKITGVIVQGIEPQSVEAVLKLRSRVIQGDFNLSTQSELPLALIGKGLAKKFHLKIGDSFKLVLPSPSKESSSQFLPKLKSFQVQGVLDLGKNDYDERYIVTNLKTAQELADVGDKFSGIRLKVQDEDQAGAIALKISKALGSSYWTMNWKEVNKNLFEAARLERLVIFFVLLIMIIAASFNISSNLFVSVLQKYQEISILKTIGLRSKDIRTLFIYQGLLIGIIGTILGLIFGLILCGLFLISQKYWLNLPGDIYRLDHVGVDIRLVDILSIVISALLICILSTLAPAIRGSKLNPVEGLRYD